MPIDFRPDVATLPGLRKVADQEPSLGTVPPGVQAARDANARVLLAAESPEERGFGPTPNATMQRRAPAGSPFKLDFQPDFQPDAPIVPAASQADVRAAEPVAPRPSQADVRAAEPSRVAQIDAERAALLEGQKRAAERQMMTRGTFGAFAPGEEEQLTAATKRRDELARERVAETGDIQYDESLAYNATKLAASLVGFVAAGPVGATVLEQGPRAAAIAVQLDKAVKDGAITEERASDIMASEMLKGMGTDAAFNFGVPALMKVLGKIPGVRRLGGLVAEKVARAGGKLGFKPGTALNTPDEAVEDMFRATVDARSMPPGREARYAKLAEATDDPLRREALGELQTRTKEVVPTPGQVTGTAGFTEKAVREGRPDIFQAAEKELKGAAEGMRQETVRGAPREDVGAQLVKAAEDAKLAVQNRLRPTFNEAKQLGVEVDAVQIGNEITHILETKGVLLSPGERAYLEAQAKRFADAPFMSPEAALDLTSALKHRARQMTVEGAPTPYFGKAVNQVIDAVEESYKSAARAAGKAQMIPKLEAARTEYKNMMATVYDDAISTAMKRNPEDVGRLLWGSGNVAEIRQAHKVIDLAVTEGKMTAKEAGKLRGNIAKGFLENAVQDVRSASQWSDMLQGDVGKRETWEALTAGPGGAELRSSMKLLEQVAQIAGHDAFSVAGGHIVPLPHAMGRAAAAVTGTNQVGFTLYAIGLRPLAGMAATAYTQGNKGVLNALAAVLRGRAAGTAAGVQGTRAAADVLRKFAEENNIDLSEQ